MFKKTPIHQNIVAGDCIENYAGCTEDALYKQSPIPSNFSFHNGYMMKFPANMMYRYTTYEI
jgi:hypothetical protein